MSVFVTGPNVDGHSPGSSLNEAPFWLDSALLVLASQLFRPQAVEEGFSYVIRYCRDTFPMDCVDAVLLSIEHNVPIHIKPNTEV